MDVRLEEIKERFKAMNELSSFKKLAPTELFFGDLDYLIQQAEKVQAWHDAYRKEVEHGNKLVKENKRYKEALEFYADDINNSLGANFPKAVSKVGADNGKKARQALKGES